MYVSAKKFNDLIKSIAANILLSGDKKYDYLFPVLRGGAIVAHALSMELDIPILSGSVHPTNIKGKILIVDDIIDSGITRKKYADFDFVALYSRSRVPDFPGAGFTFFGGTADGWVTFWWEKSDDDANDLIVRTLEMIGEDPNREGLKDTPRRVIKSYDHLYGGYKLNPADFMTVFNNEKYDEIILLKDIEFFSTCEHHMLPFFGKAHIAYIPDKDIIGISKLARILEIFSRRLQVQERIGMQVIDSLNKYLAPKAAACILEAKHFCMVSRGVEKQNSMMITSALSGSFKDKPEARQELMRLIG